MLQPTTVNQPVTALRIHGFIGRRSQSIVKYARIAPVTFK